MTDESDPAYGTLRLTESPISEPTKINLFVRDGRGVFTFEEWQNMPPEVPPPLKPWWRD